ncbi:MAG: hypothetical protein J0H10_15860 [Alphaproteobacteria bacterium]|nr:hypothetical protein [Alphaproteobacteria bacterium]
MPFKPGESGNPGGRPRNDNEVKRLARKHTKAAIERLGFWLNSDNAKASVSAAQALLDRGWGKPTQMIAGDPDGDAIKLMVTRVETVIVDAQT